MSEWIVPFPAGLAVGGLSLSAGWGLFWLGIATVGVARGTCDRRVWLNSLAVGGASLVLAGILLWGLGAAARVGVPFRLGLLGVPLLLLTVACRHAPDGRRAGAHLIEGIRDLAGQLLGRHQPCGGCSEGHCHEPQ